MSITNKVPTLFHTSNVCEWLNHLQTEGYVVISNILNINDYNTAVSLFKTDWCSVSSKWDWNDSTTWENNMPVVKKTGQAMFSGFGQSDFMWFLRTRPAFQDCYSHIHNTNNICVSMDGFSFYCSTTQKPGSWLHRDQRSSDLSYSVQGAYNILPVTETSAGFICVPRSHREIYENGNRDFVPSVNRDCIKLIIPSNCYVLWNSKTIHACSGMAQRSPKHINRVTAFITYAPRNSLDGTVRTARMCAYRDGKACSHWAHRCEIKRYPNFFKKTYESKGFGEIVPTLCEGEIPSERSMLI